MTDCFLSLIKRFYQLNSNSKNLKRSHPLNSNSQHLINFFNLKFKRARKEGEMKEIRGGYIFLWVCDCFEETGWKQNYMSPTINVVFISPINNKTKFYL